jgi:glutaredoxin-related protein
MIELGHWTSKVEFIENSIGFIYKITNNIDGRKYLGRKLILFKTSRKPLKGNKNKRRGTKQSDYMTYCGSCIELQEDIKKLGKENFTFEILEWCSSKLTLNYAEVKHIVNSNAIFDKNYYNKYLGCRLVNKIKI